MKRMTTTFHETRRSIDRRENIKIATIALFSEMLSNVFACSFVPLLTPPPPPSLSLSCVFCVNQEANRAEAALKKNPILTDLLDSGGEDDEDVEGALQKEMAAVIAADGEMSP